MIYYLDTSVAVAALTPEEATARVQDWLDEREPGELAASAWVLVEFSSALSIKLRRGDLTLEQRRLVETEWRQLAASSLSLIKIHHGHFDLAARLAEHHELGLRAGDALHLAIAWLSDCRLVTLDEKLAKAASALQVPVEGI